MMLKNPELVAQYSQDALKVMSGIRAYRARYLTTALSFSATIQTVRSSYVTANADQDQVVILETSGQFRMKSNIIRLKIT
jgi:hypothetical protein